MSIDRYIATPLTAGDYALAEGVTWDERLSRVLWVDINEATILTAPFADGRLGEIQRTTLADEDGRTGTVSAIALAEDGGLLIATAASLCTVAPDGDVGLVIDILPNDGLRRLNDGICDPAGRFLIGTMSLAENTGSEELFQVDSHRPDESPVVLERIGLANGMGFAPDGHTLYFIDTAPLGVSDAGTTTLPGIVWAADYDAATGASSAWRQAFRVADGRPDGMRVDSEGNLWIAIWGGGQVRRYTPAGEVTAIVDVPAPFTTCLAFAGDDLDTLIISSSNRDHDPAARAEFPNAGGLFTVKVPARGQLSYRWPGATI
jgi:sugar lactone lactonase YvrE